MTTPLLSKNRPIVLYVDIDGKTGGSAESLRALVNQLDKERFDPVFVFGNPCSKASWKSEKVLTIPMAGLDNYDFCRPRTDIRWIYHFIRWISHFPLDIIKSLGIIGQLRPDIVHINVGQALSFGIACRIKGIPVVWHIREMLSENLLGRIQSIIYDRCSDHIIAISNAVKERLKTTHTPICVVYNAVSAPETSIPDNRKAFRTALGIAENTFLVSLLANFQINKGYLFLADVADLLSDLPDICFLLAGDYKDIPAGSVHRTLRRLYRSASGKAGEAELIKLRWDFLRKTGRAAFPGHVQSSDAIASSDLIVCPTLVAEPFGRTVIEAYAQSKPVITTAGPAFDEIVINGETGWLIELDPAKWAERLRFLYADRKQVRKTGLAGKNQLKRFEPSRHAQEIMSLYKIILEKKQ